MSSLTKAPVFKCCGTIHTGSILSTSKRVLPLLAMLILFAANGIAQTTVFSQNFSSSTTVASYVSLIPNSGQFDAVTTAGSNTVSITGGALRFTRGNNTSSFTRSANFSPTPTALVYSFSLNISGTGGNQNSAATFQVGSGYSILTNGVETNANTYAQFGIDFRGSNANFRVRDINNNNVGNNYAVGSSYTVTWAMNNSGSTLSYIAPTGAVETVANDRMDIWIGTTKEFDDVTVQTTTGSLQDLKFAYVAGTGNIDIDNINIYSINPFITVQPSAASGCVGSSASMSVTATGTSLSYQWKKAGVALSNGGSISGATSSTLSINPLVAGDAAANYTVEVTSSGGYTAVSNNTALTVNALPTITAASAASNVCNSAIAQNAGLTYSATTNSPTSYTITWDGTALAAGLVNLGSTALPASPLNVPVAAGVGSGTYNGTLKVTNAAGCTSTGNAFTVTVNALPTITGTLTACVGSTTALTGSGTPAASNPWVSASPAVATVNTSGIVTGVSAGTSVITYTNNNGCSTTATVTINAAPAVTGTTVCTGGSGTISSSAACAVGSTVSNGPNNPATATNNTSTGSGAWTTPGNITATGSPYATQNLAAGATSNYLSASNYGFAIPAGATINGITVTINRQATGTTRINDDIVRLVKGGVITGNDLSTGASWPNSFFSTTTFGGSSNLWGSTWTPADINAANFGVVLSAVSSSGFARQIDVDYIQVTITYTTAGTLNWYTVSSGGSSIGTGTPFNPVGVAGSGLPNTNTAGTTTFYAECALVPGCRGAANFVITTPPSITAAVTAADVCSAGTAQNSTLSYSATSGTPTQYAITWDAAGLSAGLVNMSNTAITTSPLSIPVAANAAAGTYTGTLTVTSAAGCTSAGVTFTITINQSPSITPSAAAISKCFSSSGQSGVLSYSATSGSPTHYYINWDAAALAAGLVNYPTSTLYTSPLLFSLAGGAGAGGGTYNGTLFVSAANGCSGSSAFTQTIGAIPTISNSAAAASRCYNSSAQTSSLTYSATTGTPILYSITWDATAQSAGLVNLGLTALTAGQVNVPIAAGVGTGTYNGVIKVMSAIGCLSSGSAFTLTITGGAGPVMTSAATASVCSGSTFSIPLTSDIASTYAWIATDNTSVTGESLSTQTTGTLSNTLTISSGTINQTVNYTVTPTSSGGCVGTPQTVAVTVNVLPSITAAAATAARCFSATSQTTTLTYSATTNSPNRYSITWNATALAAGLVNVSNAVLPASQITISIPAGVVSNTYSGTLTVSNSVTGCSSASNAFTMAIGAAPSITTQPVNKTVCAGGSVSFTITASGTGLTYQWRKGTTNLCNCGANSGVTTATFTINPAAAGDAAANYNCVVTKSGCTSITSDYVSLTVNAAAVTPSAPPKDLVFPTVGATSVLASFTPGGDATNHLIIRTNTSTPPTNPSNGTTYTQGTSALTGYVEYTGTGTNFTSNGLTPGTTYYYWIFSYNLSSCGTSPVYNTTAVLSGNATTATVVACGTVTTLYWGGLGSGLTGATTGTDFNTASNWSTSSSSYVASPAAPSQCNNVSMNLTGGATIMLSSSAEVYGLTFTISGNTRTAILSANGNILTVNSNAVIDVLSGNTNTNIYIGEYGAGAGIVDFKANFRIGETYFAGAPNIPKSHIVGNVSSKIIFRGDVLFGRTARFILPGSVGYPPTYPIAAPGPGTTPGTLEFDGIGLQQVLWNNNAFYDCFYNIVIGNQNKPYVKHVTGTYTPDNILNNFTINDGCTVDLGTSQWIRESQGGTFTMNGSAKLILGNNQNIQSNCGTGCHTGVTVAGSNFPGGFTTMNISPSSTIEYNADNSMTQTVFGTPSVGSLTYGNLVLSNGSGAGTASKISTSTINVAGTTTISDKTTMTMGAGIVTDGDVMVNSGGRLNCATNVVSGTGSFNLLSGGTLSMGSTAGITASGATGNIQTDTRSFDIGGNYIYSASSAQATGSGLPVTVNDLTISNAAGVTMYPASVNYTVAGNLVLNSGALLINGDSLTINNLQRVSGTLTGSATSSVGISGTSVPLFFTSGGRTLKNLFLNSGASADLQTPLSITAGSSAGAVSVASGATLNTYDNLTLKSDANGTARVGQIPEDGSGNALGYITGNVMIERFIPAKRGWRMLALPVSTTGAPTINDALQEGVVNSDLIYANNQNPNPGYGIHISGSSPSLGFDPTPLNNASLLTFTRSSGAWTGISNTLTTTVRDYEGYMVFVRGNRATNLNLNTSAATSTTVLRVLGNLRTGRQTISLPGGTGAYSVIGNPFASTMDFRSVTTSGSVSAKNFVLWDPALTGTFGVGAYQYFTRSGGAGSDYKVFPGGGSYGVSGTVNNYIQSGQAFLIQNAGAGNVIIGEAAKATPSSSTVFRPMPNNTGAQISVLLSSVEADSSTTLLDGGLMMYGDDFSDSLELEDARKLFNNSENFGINKAGAIYQIEKRQHINDTDTIQYNIKSMKLKNYQLAINADNIDAAGMIAYLKDGYSNTETILTPNNTTIYPFSVTADVNSKMSDRFKIYFRHATVLPVTFTAVNAYRSKNAVNVEWKVESEINIDHYEVERSADGINFTKQFVHTGVSNNNSNNSYQWVDALPIHGLNYFRIRSVDNNGHSKYSNIAKLYFGKDAVGTAVFPNPVVDGKINIYFTEQLPGEYNVRLFNSSGQLMQSAKLQQASANGSASLTLDNTIVHGNYILEIVKPDQSKEHINILY